MEAKEERIANDIQRIITCIQKNPSQEVSNNIHSFARKVFSNGPGRPNTDSLQELKQKITAKVVTTHDQRSVIQCQETLQRFLSSTTIQHKQEVLRMLIKLSQLSNAKEENLSNIFWHSKKKDANVTIETNLSNLTESLPEPPPRRSGQDDQLRIVRNRGSIQQGVSQYELVRQLSFVFTNTSTADIIETSDGYQLRASLNVTEPVRKMVNQIADLGWLHKRIVKYSLKEGSVRKALRHAVHEQLKQFYIWNSTMEGLIKTNKLSLRRLYILSFYPQQILKWLAIILEAVEPFDGSHIISIINSYRPSGLAPVDALINRVLSFILRPLLNYIHTWIYMGELLDARGEFFISENKKVYESDEWNDRFKLIGENIPSILNSESARMIFNAGKSTYFLKNKFKIHYNVKTPFIETEKIENNNNFIGTSSLISTEFMSWLTAAHNQINEVLVQTLLKKFHLKYHLSSIKSFFLCGKGDFIQHLYDNLHEKLSQNKQQISEHSLNGHISDALAKCFTDLNFKLPNSNNHFKESIVDRLGAKKIEFSNAIDGWDCFNFQYNLDGIEPLQAIFSPESMINYQKIFNFMWKLKRVESTLKAAWVSLSREEAFKMRNIKSRQLFRIFHFVYLMRNAMLAFINTLHSYFMVTIESRWKIFWQEVDATKSFDQILKKHKEFQLDILEIILSTPKVKNLQETIYNIFKVIKDFKLVLNRLQQNFDDYFEKLRLYEDRQAMAQRGIIVESLQIPEFNLGKSSKDAREVKDFFDSAIKNLYLQLKKEGESKVSNLNALIAKIDFNEYYSNIYMEQE